MKKPIFVFLSISLILYACTTSQATIIPEATVTLPPPTNTPNPFVILQEMIPQSTEDIGIYTEYDMGSEDFVRLAEKYIRSGISIYVLNPDTGRYEIKTPDNHGIILGAHESRFNNGTVARWVYTFIDGQLILFREIEDGFVANVFVVPQENPNIKIWLAFGKSTGEFVEGQGQLYEFVNEEPSAFPYAGILQKEDGSIYEYNPSDEKFHLIDGLDQFFGSRLQDAIVKLSQEHGGGTVTNRIEEGDGIIEFNDGTRFAIDGYKLEQIFTQEELWQQEVETWNLTPESYTIKYDMDGNITIINNGKLAVLYWNGYWNRDVMKRMIVESQSCQPTRWVGVVGQGTPKEDADSFRNNYMLPIMNAAQDQLKDIGYSTGGLLYSTTFLGGPDNCWATFPVRRTGNGIDWGTNTYLFWKDVNGKLQYEAIFHPDHPELVDLLQRVEN